MKTDSVREIRLAFPAVLKAVKDGETVAITSRRKVVATLGPPPTDPARKRPWSDLESRLALGCPTLAAKRANFWTSIKDDGRRLPPSRRLSPPKPAHSLGNLRYFGQASGNRQ